MSATGPLQEVWQDVRTEVWERRAQVLAGLTYVVLAAGALYLFSSIGEDSREWYDTVRRTTLARVGIGLLGVGVLLGAVTLVVDRGVRRRTKAGAVPRHLRSPRFLLAAMVTGATLIAAGLLALANWS